MRWVGLVFVVAACGAPGSLDGGTCESRVDWGKGGAEMFPGTDCLRCHVAGGRASGAFSAGGTVFSSSVCPTPAQGAVVAITDSMGATVRLDVNAVGNFFTEDTLSPPLRVAIEANGKRVEMKASAVGGCGACHQAGSGPGQLVAP